MASIEKRELLSADVSGGATGSTFELDKENNFIGFLKVSAYTSGTIDVRIQHSPNNSDWFDLVNFSDLVATGSEAVNITSNVFKYVRAVELGSGVGTVLCELHLSER